MQANGGHQTTKTFMQGKKMKKRKELDALKGDRMKGGYEQLNRSNRHTGSLASSSSRDADTYFAPIRAYGIGSKTNVKNVKTGCTTKRMFQLCLPACVLALVAACVTSSVGIVWMQVQLKSDIDRVKDRIHKLEVWKMDEPAAMADLQTTVNQLQRDIEAIQQGENGISVLQTQLATLAHKVNADSDIDHDKALAVPQLQDQVTDVQKDLTDVTVKIARLRETISTLEKDSRSSTQKASRISDELATLNRFVHQSTEKDTDGSSVLPQRYAMALEKHDLYLNSTVDALRSRIKMVENSMEHQRTLSTELRSMSEQQVSLRSDVNALRKGLSTMNESVEALHRNDLSLEKRVTNIESTVAGTASSSQRVPSQATFNDVAHAKGNGLSPDAHPLYRPQSNKKTFETGVTSENLSLEDGPDASAPRANVHQDTVSPSRDTDVRVGDTTTSFTELPAGKRTSHGATKVSGEISNKNR